MDVAVAEMAERHRPRARDQFYDGGVGLFDKVRHGGDRYRDIMLDRAAFRLLRRRHLVAQLPERLALAEVGRDDGVVDDAVLHSLGQDRLQRIAGVVARRRQFHQHVPGMLACEGIADLDAVADREIDRDLG